MRQDNVLISMDGHTEGFVDLRSHLPRQYHEQFSETLAYGKSLFHKAEQYYATLVLAGVPLGFEVKEGDDFNPENFDLKFTPQERLQRIDADGIAAELIIDGFGAISDDPKLAHQITLAYNRWFSDTYMAVAPDRFQAAVVVNLIAGVETVVEEIKDVHAHGLKAIHLPGNPASAFPGSPHYNHSMYEPIWRLCNDLGMVVIFHASMGREKQTWRMDGSQRGALALEMIDICHSHERALMTLLLAGVPERYPNIRFGWIESGCRWVPAVLDECDMYFLGPVDHPEFKLNMTPTEQWKQSCFAAGPLIKADLDVRNRLGVHTIMFGSDFIHVEGTYPESRKRLNAAIVDLTPKERAMVCTENGARILGFDVAKLTATRSAEHELVWA